MPLKRQRSRNGGPMSYLGLLFEQNREILELLRSIRRDTQQLLKNDSQILASLEVVKQEVLNGAKESDLLQVITAEQQNSAALAKILDILVPQPIAGFTVTLSLNTNQ